MNPVKTTQDSSASSTLNAEEDVGLPEDVPCGECGVLPGAAGCLCDVYEDAREEAYYDDAREEYYRSNGW